MDSPAHSYSCMRMADGKFGVFVVHRETPEWYRLVAIFMNEGRASDFAEMENQLADDELGPAQEKSAAPVAVLPVEPASGLTVERLTRTVTETVTAERVTDRPVTMAEIVDAEREAGKPSGRKGIPYTPANRVGRPPKAKNADAVLEAWKRLAKGSDEMPAWGELSDAAGVPKGSIGAALDALEDRGDIYRDDHGLRRLGPKPPEPPSSEEPFIKAPTKQQLMAGR